MLIENQNNLFIEVRYLIFMSFLERGSWFETMMPRSYKNDYIAL